VEIVVTIKHVPDPNIPPAHFSIDPSGRRVVVPSGMPPLMNGYDANALEAALRLREKHGGSITAISLGDDGARDSLRKAIAMGANKAILVSDPALDGADSALTARALAAAIRRIGSPDLVMCGRQSSDTDAGQVLFRIAALLELPVVSPIRAIDTYADGALVVQRLGEEITQRVRVTLPAVLGVSSEINEPRYPAMKGIMAANRAQIPAWSLEDLGMTDSTRLVELERVYVEERSGNVELVQGDSGAEIGAKLADRLREAGVI